MKGSMEMPLYYIKTVNREGIKYNIKHAVTQLALSQGESDLAQKASFRIVNGAADGKKQKNCLHLGDRVYISYDIGGGPVEKFRGYIWAREYSDDTGKEIAITAYDNLIYLQKSMDNFYFPKGRNTFDNVSTICKKWGISLRYQYKSIVHPKVLLRNRTLSDGIIELLEEVKKKTGEKYVIKSEKSVVTILSAGKNKTVYEIANRRNAESTSTSETLEGMVTKVIISGPTDKEDRVPVVAAVTGNTKKFGTLQEVIAKDRETSLQDVKKEANQILKEKGKPFKAKNVETVDNPAISRGDAVKITAGGIYGTYLVKSIDHDAVNHTMSLEVY